MDNPADASAALMWFAAVDALVKDPEAPPPPLTEGGEQVRVERRPEPGVRVRLHLPVTAPGQGPAEVTVFEPALEPHGAYPSSLPFVSNCLTVVTQPDAKGRGPVVQWRELSDVESAMATLIASSTQEGWTLVSRNQVPIGPGVQFVASLTRDEDRREVVGSLAAGDGFVVLEDAHGHD